MNGLFSVLFNLVSVVLGISTGQNFPPPLPAKEERELFQKMKDGDRSARGKLIEHNLRLVSHIVRKYYASSTCPDELISVGSSPPNRYEPMMPISGFHIAKITSAMASHPLSPKPLFDQMPLV